MKKKYYVLIAIICLSTYSGIAQINGSLFSDFQYRNFGAHRVGAWVSDIAVPETDEPEYKYTFYIAARHGGVWKTINNGVTFELIPSVPSRLLRLILMWYGWERARPPMHALRTQGTGSTNQLTVVRHLNLWGSGTAITSRGSLFIPQMKTSFMSQ